jgi:hypothetical protein
MRQFLKYADFLKNYLHRTMVRHERLEIQEKYDLALEMDEEYLQVFPGRTIRISAMPMTYKLTCLDQRREQ